MSTRAKVTWNGRAASAAVERVREHAIAETTAALHAEAAMELQRLVYDTPESPNYERTGNLAQSVGHELRGGEGEVFASADYAVYVHEGTRYMAPRPFLTRAVRKVVRAMPERLVRLLERELR